MVAKHFAAYNKLLMVVVVIGVLLIDFLPSYAFSNEDIKKNEQEDIQLLGIVGPDGVRTLVPLTRPLDADMERLLAPYPTHMKESIKFYSLSSWQDMARMLSAINERQTRVIRQLVIDQKHLTKRISRLEKRSRATVYSQSVNSRLNKLEKRVNAAFDGGNR